MAGLVRLLLGVWVGRAVCYMIEMVGVFVRWLGWLGGLLNYLPVSANLGSSQPALWLKYRNGVG